MRLRRRTSDHCFISQVARPFDEASCKLVPRMQQPAETSHPAVPQLSAAEPRGAAGAA